MDLVTGKLVDFEKANIGNDQGTSLCKHAKANMRESGKQTEMLSLILQKVERHDNVLNEIKEGVPKLYEIIASEVYQYNY